MKITKTMPKVELNDEELEILEKACDILQRMTSAQDDDGVVVPYVVGNVLDELTNILDNELNYMEE